MTGAEFRAWRDRMGYTQAEAADQLGQTIRSIAYFERGERRVSRTVAILAERLENDRMVQTALEFAVCGPRRPDMDDQR